MLKPSFATWSLLLSASSALAVACSGSENSAGGSGGASAQGSGGQVTSGNGGSQSTGTGGTTATTGGVTSTGSGGANGGSGPASGGTLNGGASNGGASSGGASTAGSTSGGSVNGGSVNGGSVNGGSVNGGASSSGGSATGGVNRGGASNGGTSSGGSSSGGASSGGTSSGGSSSGGASSGGTSSGGAASGGAASGGNANACPLDLVGFATREGGTTGGGSVAPTTVTTQAELRACATATEARVCRVQGTLTFSPFEEIRVTSNKTIIGAGANAAIVMGGFFLNVGVKNVIIRNLTIRDSYIEGQYDTGGDNGGDRDGVQMDTVDHVWIDHVHFNHLGDGQIDSRKDTTLLTVSWNILENHNKAFGIGWTESVTAQMTIHHNWLYNTTQRNPSTDNVLRAHLYNNVMENITSYGNYARGGTNMVLQNSVFINVANPHYYDTGTLVAINNVYRSTTGTRTQTGTTFSFFDPSTFYSYKLDPVDQVEALVKRCAGPRAELGN
ncbi:MAG: hypothetical protein QM756_01895 [Polyangiaceae bacterium]